MLDVRTTNASCSAGSPLQGRSLHRERSTRPTALAFSTDSPLIPTWGTTESRTSRATCVGYRSAYRSATKVPYDTPSRFSLSTPSARRSRSMSCTVWSVPKNRRFGPIARAQAVTAAFVGGARSELPIWAWRAGHWSAFGPVPRWSIRTSR